MSNPPLIVCMKIGLEMENGVVSPARREFKVRAPPPLQVLFKNRWTVLYCTLLAKTESSSEREAIEEEMREDPDKAAILNVSFT